MNTKVKSLTRNLGQAVSKNSPIILTGLGVAGLITTTVMAVKATPRAIELLDEEIKLREQEKVPNAYLEPLTTAEIVTLTWRCYVPAAIMGSVTIACIIWANSINLRRNAALASVYSLSEAALKEYQAKVVETIGKNKEQKVRDDIAQDRLRRNPVTNNEIVMTGKGETLCYDNLSGRYFKSDIEEIRRVCNNASRDMMTQMFVTINEVYTELGLQATKMGEEVGWHIDDGTIEPNFSSQLTDDGTPCLVLDFTIEPRYGYNNY